MRSRAPLACGGEGRDQKAGSPGAARLRQSGKIQGGWSPTTPPARRAEDEIRAPATLVEAIQTRLRTRVRFPPSPHLIDRGEVVRTSHPDELRRTVGEVDPSVKDTSATRRSFRLSETQRSLGLMPNGRSGPRSSRPAPADIRGRSSGLCWGPPARRLASATGLSRRRRAVARARRI